MGVPAQVYAGETLTVSGVVLSDYPAATYNVAFKIVSPSTMASSTSCTGSGSTWGCTVAPTVTTNWTGGQYVWQLVATAKTGGAVAVAETGMLSVIGAPVGLTHARAALTAIEAAIESRATSDQSSFSITPSLSVGLLNPEQLTAFRDYYRNEIQRLESQWRASMGLGSGRRVLTRFES